MQKEKRTNLLRSSSFRTEGVALPAELQVGDLRHLGMLLKGAKELPIKRCVVRHCYRALMCVVTRCYVTL